MAGTLLIMAVLAILGVLATTVGADSRPGAIDEHRHQRLADWW